VVGYFVRRTNDVELAADLTSEVFAAALTAADRHRPEAPTAAAGLFTIAHHTLARSVRRGRVEARARHRLGIRDAFELEPGQIERVQASLAAEEWVAHLLDGLPPDQQQAIRERILDELPHHEIAERMQTSELMIRKRVSRGLASPTKPTGEDTMTLLPQVRSQLDDAAHRKVATGQRRLEDHSSGGPAARAGGLVRLVPAWVRSGDTVAHWREDSGWRYSSCARSPSRSVPSCCCTAPRNPRPAQKAPTPTTARRCVGAAAVADARGAPPAPDQGRS
jgi:RNA polymerase sigma factor (sigma-70 family)